MQNYYKISCRTAPDVTMKVIPGHFATPNSHINYYIDMTTMKSRLSEARNTAKAIAQDYMFNTIVDSIVCMDGCEVIGACLADEMTRGGFTTINQHNTIYVIQPEFDRSGQMIFRENMQMMVKNKYVLLLLASATTGTTVSHAINSIQFYGGQIAGISAIFSAVKQIHGYDVQALFSADDLQDYCNYAPHECELCKRGVKIDAICNGHGYTQL